MKKLVFFVVLIIAGFNLKSQTIAPTTGTTKLVDESAIETNSQRYLIDYEIKGWDGAIKDTDKINQLNLDFFDSKRKEKDDVEEYDTTTGLTVIVYSERKTTVNKTK